MDGQLKKGVSRRGQVKVLTSERVWIFLVAIVAIVLAAALLFLPFKFQLAMIMAIPASLGLVVIIRRPFVGVFLYYVYTFLRPYDFIPAIDTLKLGTLMAMVTFAAWLAYAIRFRCPIRWDKFNYYYLLYLAVIGSGAFWALNNFKPYKVWEAGFTEFIAFVTAVNVIQNRKQLYTLLWALVGIHVYFVFKGVYNYVFWANQLGAHTTGAVGSGFIGDENDFAMALNVMLPIAFFSLLAAKKRWMKFVGIGAIGLYLIGIVLSQSRGGFVGLIAVVAMIIWMTRKYFVGIIVAGVAILSVLALAPEKFVGELLNIGDTNEATADARIKYWQAGLRMYADYPIVGVGADVAGVHMPNYIRGVRNPKTEWGRVFHGLFPQLLAELGTVGTGLWLLMFITMLYNLNRIRRMPVRDDAGFELNHWAKGLMGAMVGYVVTSTFLSTAYYPQIWTLYTLSFILIWLHRSYQGNPTALRSGIPIGRPEEPEDKPMVVA